MNKKKTIVEPVESRDDWDEETHPDRYCVSMPDGSCISEDPRCMHNAPAPSLESQRATLCVRVAEARAALRAAIHEREVFDSMYPDVLPSRIESMSAVQGAASDSHSGPRKVVGPRSAKRASRRLKRGLAQLLAESDQGDSPGLISGLDSPS